jgi:UDP-glucuronate 4-epimerase
MNVLVTGSAGFIGFHLCKKLLESDVNVVGVDNFNDYYDVSLKEARNKIIEAYDNFKLYRVDISDKKSIDEIFSNHKFDCVVNLAAQAGVRYSITNPDAYLSSNLVGFGNILEACRNADSTKLVYASSSSVYGANTEMPFKTEHNVDKPVSLYAATKKANELMAHSYSHLYKIETIGLRFFTVYGPWGRPDMAPFKFAKQITEGGQIDLYNNGDHLRDFTYIDDIVDGILLTINIDRGNEVNKDLYRIYNIGCNTPVHLLDFVSEMETAFNKKVNKNFLPMQPGDVYATYADVQGLIDDFGYKPSTNLKYGMEKFSNWYSDFYGVAE